MRPIILVTLLAACGDNVALAPDATPNDSIAKRQFDHVFFIMMENHGTDEIIGNTADAPYINSLANQYGVAMNYYGVTHPSLPNYLSMFSGDFQGIWDDCKAGSAVTCAPEEFVANSGDATSTLLLSAAQVASASAIPHWFAGENLVDRLEAKSVTWKAYMQSMPTADPTVEYSPVDAVTGAPRKLYAQKHNPFMYFSDIRNSPARMANIVPADALQADLAADTLPSFSWLSPDQCHDMHGVSPTNAVALGIPECGYPASGLDHSVIALGDAYLSTTVAAIQASPAWGKDSAIVIAWDEDDYSGYAGCCDSPTTSGAALGGAKTPAIVITSKTNKHEVDVFAHNHYSMLATILSLWGLPCLGQTCNLSPSDLMTDLFRP